ncbi:NADH-quinone oxidoreductase subunit L [Candidatus Marinarcus aquaticus]|uniref:NADH-quinone oxidoreductase subunit L n=1 Tax=Candidatus Marinarcus aquaticus TaxID=2044504 RepID=A0A4Q0XP53_9BACT|nr:NADH-quinone oxidoreductase subunit L [Candidatus Marinarcus aquaticus]RXJ56501.1 NADH-quinone oxidoreductase subunit L [Candidatus Marinarcus aquaticus]
MHTSFLVWIILAPLIGSILNAAFYIYHIKRKPLPESLFAWIGTVTPFLAFLFTLCLFTQMYQTGVTFEQSVFTWMDIGGLTIEMKFLGDNLAIFMSMFVTFVGWLIHIYAVGYMKGDEGFGKFFAYFNLFLASMLILVLADNPIILFIGWEGVGVCSYLLISFYYTDAQNVIAGNKAFIANRVGDLGFILGVVTLFFALNKTGLSFSDMEANIDLASGSMLAVAGFLLFVGAMGKSAQVPLYVWLPDAMAGPTPISALIHAATMVTAGVYMVARFHFLYTGVEDIGLFISYIGAISALLAAVIATRQTDIKKILAYSTMSQLGYMFIAVGLGFYSSGLFHVFTHAFFKAMLFMGAGAAILALHHEQNIFKMAQHRVYQPIVKATFLIGVIAISGIPPFSGFFSKDAILAAAYQEGEFVLYGIGIFTAFLTAFYMFRLYFVVFVAPNGHDVHYASTDKTITFPLLVLAIGAVFAGFLNFPAIFGGSHMVDTWLAQTNSIELHMSHATEYILMLSSIVVASLGILVAYLKYGKYDVSVEEKEDGIIGNKFYIDELYDILFVKSLQKVSQFFDKVVDDKIVDGFIMMVSREFIEFGKKLAFLQNANVRFYALYMLIGMSCTFLYLYNTLIGQ